MDTFKRFVVGGFIVWISSLISASETAMQTIVAVWIKKAFLDKEQSVWYDGSNKLQFDQINFARRAFCVKVRQVLLHYSKLSFRLVNNAILLLLQYLLIAIFYSTSPVWQAVKDVGYCYTRSDAAWFVFLSVVQHCEAASRAKTAEPV